MHDHALASCHISGIRKTLRFSALANPPRPLASERVEGSQRVDGGVRYEIKVQVLVEVV